MPEEESHKIRAGQEAEREKAEGLGFLISNKVNSSLNLT